MKVQLWVTFSLALCGLAHASAGNAEEPAIAGVTEPVKNVVLKAWGKKTPPWSGRIAKLYVKEGDHVAVGQVLLEMDRREEEIEVRLRQAAARDNGELNTVRERERVQKGLWQLNRSVAAENRSVSKEDVAKRELEYRITLGERQRIEVQEDRAKIELESAQLDLENRVLRSPIEGTVIKVHLHEGETCETNDPLIHLVDVSKCYFIANVEEKVGRNLSVGQSVNLKIQAGGGQEPKTGTIVFVSPVVEPASFLLQIKAEFGNGDGKIRPGVPGTMTPLPAGP